MDINFTPAQKTCPAQSKIILANCKLYEPLCFAFFLKFRLRTWIPPIIISHDASGGAPKKHIFATHGKTHKKLPFEAFIIRNILNEGNELTAVKEAEMLSAKWPEDCHWKGQKPGPTLPLSVDATGSQEASVPTCNSRMLWQFEESRAREPSLPHPSLNWGPAAIYRSGLTGIGSRVACPCASMEFTLVISTRSHYSSLDRSTQMVLEKVHALPFTQTRKVLISSISLGGESWKTFSVGPCFQVFSTMHGQSTFGAFPDDFSSPAKSNFSPSRTCILQISAHS